LVVVQGRALLNAVGNLELKDEYSAALHKLGHDLEAVAEQVLNLFCFYFIFLRLCPFRHGPG
jgi:hypothetical protein